MLRLSTGLAPCDLEDLKRRFDDLLRPAGVMVLTGALPAEADQPEIAHLPRLVIDFNRRDFGRLRMLIDAINDC